MTDRIEEIRARLARVAEGTCDSERMRSSGFTGPDPCFYDDPYHCVQHDDEEVWREDVSYLLTLVPRWIPVTERLPEEGERTLTAYDNIGVNEYIGDVAGNGPTWNTDECQGVWPTHWMPLPEPPKEGE
jgi:hypothetical protein